LAKSIFAPLEIPVGIITAVLGGSYLLFLLRRGQIGIRK
jgi:iron complex transport system permease protein